MRERPIQVTLDVGEHAEVWLGAGVQLPRLARELECFEEVGTRVGQRPRLDGEAAERVQRFGRQNRVADLQRPRVTAAAQLACQSRPVALIAQYREAPQRF